MLTAFFKNWIKWDATGEMCRTTRGASKLFDVSTFMCPIRTERNKIIRGFLKFWLVQSGPTFEVPWLVERFHQIETSWCDRDFKLVVRVAECLQQGNLSLRISQFSVLEIKILLRYVFRVKQFHSESILGGEISLFPDQNMIPPFSQLAIYKLSS